jgi:hypothetical protein
VKIFQPKFIKFHSCHSRIFIRKPQPPANANANALSRKAIVRTEEKKLFFVNIDEPLSRYSCLFIVKRLKKVLRENFGFGSLIDSGLEIYLGMHYNQVRQHKNNVICSVIVAHR